MESIKILLVDDHIIVRNGIKSLLESEEGIQVVGEASNGAEAVSEFERLSPDLVIMDIRMPKMNGIEATRAIKQNYHNSKIIILSMHDIEDYVLQAVESGADGYLLKDTGKESFIKALQKVHEGEKYFSSDISYIIVNQYLNKVDTQGTDDKTGAQPAEDKFNLTRREKQVLKLVIDGLTNKEIAEQLGKSVRTIETHRFKIMKKLNVHNAIEMLKVVEENNLFSEE